MVQAAVVLGLEPTPRPVLDLPLTRGRMGARKFSFLKNNNNKADYIIRQPKNLQILVTRPKKIRKRLEKNIGKTKFHTLKIGLARFQN
jgi:hypothetical protein